MRPTCEISSGRWTAGGRKILDEIQLPLEQQSEVRLWLLEALGALELHPGFVQRILESAGDAVQRAACREGPAAQQGYIHLIISAPGQARGESEAWGFFRIEKLEAATGDMVSPNHSIEFYLYFEGD